MEDTLILLNFGANSVHFVKVSEYLVKALVEKYDNDVETWADEMFASDIGVDMGNCQWMFVSGNPDIFENRQVRGVWKETKINPT